MIKKQTRIKNQIKSLLSFYNIKITEEKLKEHWSRRYIDWIERVKMNGGSGESSKKALIEDLMNVRRIILKLTKEIRILSRSEEHGDDIKLLLTVPGIGIISGMILLTEIIDINRFGGLDRINSYAGLIPSEDSSGEEERKGEIINRGNKIIRTTLIESAWVAIRKDPALAMEYKRLIVRMKKTEAIIRIARKLLNRIRYVLKNKKPYILGIVK
jgi:transposase